MNLKIGGNSVGKIMYNGQEFGGATKLEPDTILYISNREFGKIENAHLLNTTKKWENINGISIAQIIGEDVLYRNYEANISGDDFKNLDIKKDYKMLDTVTVSRSTVDGEYRLNVSGYRSRNYLVVRAI